MFFGEETTSNFVVLCHPEDATYPVSSVFQDAYNDGSAPVEFRLLDCKHVLSSEKTVYERFKLDEKKRPTVFVSGVVGTPKQVSAYRADGITGSVPRGVLSAQIFPVGGPCNSPRLCCCCRDAIISHNGSFFRKHF